MRTPLAVNYRKILEINWISRTLNLLGFILKNKVTHWFSMTKHFIISLLFCYRTNIDSTSTLQSNISNRRERITRLPLLYSNTMEWLVERVKRTSHPGSLDRKKRCVAACSAAVLEKIAAGEPLGDFYGPSSPSSSFPL